MIKELGKRKYVSKNGNYKNNKNNKNNAILKYKNIKKTKKQIQKGGNKERFEIVKLADIDYSNFTLSKYLDSDIEWGNFPGKPPTTCSIL